MPFDPIQKFIPKIANLKNFGHTYKAIEVCQAFKHVAEEVLPPEALTGVAPKSFKDGALTVATFNTVCAELLGMRSHQVLSALNARLGTSVVKKIKIIPEVIPSNEAPTPGSF